MEKMQWLWQEVIFQKSQELLVSRPLSLPRTKNQCGGYITCHWNWMNSYWAFWIGGLSMEVFSEQFLQFFEKITFCNFTAFFSFLTKASIWIFRCASKRSTLAYLCRNIKFNLVDFSERHSVYVIKFLLIMLEKRKLIYHSQCMLF